MRKGDPVLRRVALCGVVLAVGASVSAQRRIMPEPNQDAVKFQEKNFEQSLKMAVERGAQDVAEQARAIVPGVLLGFLSDVDVTGWWTPEDGYTFNVVIPGIGTTSALLFRMVQQQPDARAAVVPVNSSTGTSATSVATSDPMMKSPVAPFDPSKEYAERVRLALIDALVENSGALQFKPGQKVQIVAGPAPQAVPNPLEPDARKLILIVKGEDLMAYRQGHLKHDELMARIVERRF